MCSQIQLRLEICNLHHKHHDALSLVHPSVSGWSGLLMHIHPATGRTPIMYSRRVLLRFTSVTLSFSRLCVSVMKRSSMASRPLCVTCMHIRHAFVIMCNHTQHACMHTIQAFRLSYGAHVGCACSTWCEVILESSALRSYKKAASCADTSTKMASAKLCVRMCACTDLHGPLRTQKTAALPCAR